MSDTQRLKGWIDQLGEEGMRATARWLRSIDMLAAGTYEPKNALSDWYFFMSRGLAFLPPAPATTGQTLPLVSLTVHAGQDSAVALRSLHPARANAHVTADLVEKTNANKTIPQGDVVPALHDGGRTLLLTAQNLAARNLTVGETYTGRVMDGAGAGANAIASIELQVLG